MTDIPDIILKSLVSFPATVVGGDGIEVSKDAGTYTLDLDYSEIAAISAPSVPASSFLVVWDSTTGVYSRISLVNLKAALASIP